MKWAPNLAVFAAAFCSLCTHARQGSNSEPWPLTAPNLNFVLGARFGPDALPSSPLSLWIFSLQQRTRGPTYIKTKKPLQNKMASLPSPSSISFKRPFDPISNISPWQSCAPVTRQLRQNHKPNHNPNRSRSWSAELANALSWRHRNTPTVLSW